MNRCIGMAVHQPATLVFAAVAPMSQDGDPCAPASMALMGGPIDTRESPKPPNRLAKERRYGWFERNPTDTVPATATTPGSTTRST